VTVFTRKRLVVAGLVAAFLAVFAGIGAVSRSNSSAAPSVVVTPAGSLPSVLWYWTMAVSPSDPNVLLLATSGGLYRSADGGGSWASTGPKNVNATSLVQSGHTLYAGGVRVKPGVPSAGVIRRATYRVATDGAAVLASSGDDGKTWQVLHPRGLPSISVQALAVDPASSDSLYALLNTGKLYRSTDGAKSFRLVSPRLGINPWAIALTTGGHFVGGDMDGGPSTSANGKSWQPTTFKDSRGTKMVMEYAVQPNDANRVLMTSFGILSSTDGGKTWHPALSSRVMFGPVAYAPSKPTTAYAVGFDGSLWRSDNSGTSWKKVP
jgi:photosystem II stability/assembly factor-like uncharacterized protein